MAKTIKLIQAFEEMENQDNIEMNVDDLDAKMLEQEQDSTEIEAMTDQVEDAEETQEVLEKMDEAKTPEEAVTIAKEHFLNRLGYTPIVSIESFKSSDEHFKTKLNNSLTYAQEGMVSRVVSAIRQLFTTQKALVKQADDNYKKLVEKGVKEKDIASPGWGRSLAINGKKEVTAEDVLKKLNDLSTVINGSKLKGLLQKAIGIIENASKEKKEAGDDADSRISEMKVQLKAISEEVQAEVAKAMDSEQVKKQDSVFKPVTPEQGKKLLDAINKLLTSIEFSSTLDKLDAIYLDMADEKGFDSSIGGTFNGAYKLASFRNKVCYSTSQYIRASSK